MNKLAPGSVSKINTTGAQFKMMENINRFQEAAKKYGVSDIDVFQTVDLWEKRNIPQVTQCIMAIGRAVSIAGAELVGAERVYSTRTSFNRAPRAVKSNLPAHCLAAQ